MHCRARPTDSVDLLHDGDDVYQMFDDVIGANLREQIVREGSRTDIQVVDHIGQGICSDVNIHGAVNADVTTA